MAPLRQTVRSLLPEPLLSLWKKLRAFKSRIFDQVGFPLWLALLSIRHRKKIVILCRTGALGDVICALPLADEIRKRHPGTLLVFVTNFDYKSMLLLSPDLELIYGAKSWTWPFALPEDYNFLGLVEKVYSPRTTSEISKNGPQAHLMEDQAQSCGLTLTNPHPRLIVPPQLLKSVPVKFGFAEHINKGRLIIGINCGQVWPVRMWDPAKWANLLDLIHADYDAAILQFGFRKGDKDEYDNMRGVQTELRMPMEKDELVALVANCHLMISVDSGPVHISGAVGVPVVGLYGALKPEFFLPRFSPAGGRAQQCAVSVLQSALRRLGYWQSGCPNDITCCMKELEVQPVYQAVKSMLDKYTTAGRK